MKKTTTRKLQLSKMAIARIDKLTQQTIEGGQVHTDTISECDSHNEPIIYPPIYEMSQVPDENGICYAIQ
ncbi:hypothetical protein [uncultured Kordia sp.]|uniref:hypothetical protein n=1 Tax=uncultured Kordia sp. TaxID=507699 RepID=UPI00261907C2|nr:hypothetical protein [uncultured Kordia sp.]